MDEIPQPALRIALLAEESQRGGFRALLQQQGVDLVLDQQLGVSLPDEWNGAEVVLVSVSREAPRSRIDTVLDQLPLPAVLHAGGVGSTEAWSRGLLAKLELLARDGTPGGGGLREVRCRPELRVVGDSVAESTALALPWVIVLGASMGGPKAVARFLQVLPGELPVVFLLVQHISGTFQNLLAEQLDRCGPWRVAVLEEEQELKPGNVWVLPADNKVAIDSRGYLRPCDEPWDSAQRPDINAVLRDVSGAFGARCGAIMFSGLGSGGAQGCGQFARQGGFVWVQSAASCVIAHLPEAARQSGNVDFSGTPEELARELATRSELHSTSIN